MHLYFTDKELSFLDKYKDAFSNYCEVDLSENKDKQLNGGLVFIEIKNLTKTNFRILNDFVKANSSKDIYIFASDYENSLLLKFSLHFSLNKPLPLDINEAEFEKILLHSAKKYILKLEERRENEIGKILTDFFPLVIMKNNYISFANQLAKDMFDTTTIHELNDILKNFKIISQFLDSDEDKTEFVLEKDDTRYKYIIYKKFITNSQTYFLTFVPLGEENPDEIKIMDRLRFIEELKDKLVQVNIDNSPISLILINIVNYEKLVKATDTLEYHNFIKEFINKLNRHKKPYQELIQWDSHLFILLNFEEYKKAKEDLNYIHQKIIYEHDKSKISPVIISTILNIEQQQINDVIKNIDQISSRNFDPDSFNKDTFMELKHLDSFIDEKEQIRYYLQSFIANNTPIKLLNIYKGLCINTKSKVIKIEDDDYFVHCESLQGYSMQFDDKTVIQSPDLPKDIEADVTYVNIGKSYAVLENLKFLNSSANNRQHTRVQPKIRTPIMLKHKKFAFQGEILDISTKAVAIKVNRIIDESIKNEKVELKFKLPDEDAENGFVYMEVDGVVVHTEEIEVHKSKVVVMLELDKPYDSFLLKYMYVRQKELILELKKAVKLAGK